MNKSMFMVVAWTAVAATHCASAFGDSPLVVDSAGRAIGYLIGACNTDYLIVSRTGYMTCISTFGLIDQSVLVPGGDLNGVWLFAEQNCAGPIYLRGNNSVSGVVVTNGSLGVMMVLKDSPVTTQQIYSSEDNTGCASGTFFATDSVVLGLPNDPNVTGFFNVPYSGPVSVQVLPDSVLSDEIFFDGLEAY